MVDTFAVLVQHNGHAHSSPIATNEHRNQAVSLFEAGVACIVVIVIVGRHFVPSGHARKLGQRVLRGNEWLCLYFRSESSAT